MTQVQIGTLVKVVVLLFLVFGVYQTQSCSQHFSGTPNKPAEKPPEAATSQSQTPSEITSESTAKQETLDDRLGDSDGFAASIFFSSDLTGSIDVCGCAQNPQGGVARQRGFLSAFEQRYPGVPYMHIDLGHSFSERTRPNSTMLYEPVQVGNEWVIRAYNAMSVTALNISFRDLIQLNHTFATDVYTQERRLYPILDRYVSANVRPKSDTHIAPKPYLIHALKGGGLKQPLKVGLIGLTEQGSLPLEHFEIDDPIETAQRVIPEVRAKADLVVVMGYLPRPVAQRLAQSGLPYDALLTANRLPQVEPIRRIHQKIWATSLYEGRFLGELRIYLDEHGHLTHLKNRYVPLDKAVPDDPDMASLRDQARAAMDAAGAVESSQ